MKPESARFYPDPIDPSTRSLHSLGRDDRARAGINPAPRRLGVSHGKEYSDLRGLLREDLGALGAFVVRLS